MKDYEIYEKTPVNFRAIIIIGIIILFTVFYVNGIYSKYAVKETPTPVITCKSEAIQIEYVTVLVTPTPDGNLYYAGEYQNGIRKIQNPFTFTRDDTSGLKDLKITTVVYDVKRLDKLHWHNPTDYKYYLLQPNPNNDFLIVYVGMYQDDTIYANDTGYKDTRFYFPQPEKFVVYDITNGNTFYHPVSVAKQVRYKELEYSRDFTNTIQAEYFGQKRHYSREEKYMSTAGEYSEVHEILRGGISNAESGYIIYEIPKVIPTENLVFGINFYSWGDAFWRLSP